MAKLMLIGEAAQVEIITDPDGATRIAKCVKHGGGPGGWPGIACDWSETYDDLNDATEYAEGHADTGRR